MFEFGALITIQGSASDLISVYETLILQQTQRAQNCALIIYENCWLLIKSISCHIFTKYVIYSLDIWYLWKYSFVLCQGYYFNCNTSFSSSVSNLWSWWHSNVYRAGIIPVKCSIFIQVIICQRCLGWVLCYSSICYPSLYINLEISLTYQIRYVWC